VLGWVGRRVGRKGCRQVRHAPVQTLSRVWSSPTQPKTGGHAAARVCEGADPVWGDSDLRASVKNGPNDWVAKGRGDVPLRRGGACDQSRCAAQVVQVGVDSAVVPLGSVSCPGVPCPVRARPRDGASARSSLKGLAGHVRTHRAVARARIRSWRAGTAVWARLPLGLLAPRAYRSRACSRCSVVPGVIRRRCPISAWSSSSVPLICHRRLAQSLCAEFESGRPLLLDPEQELR
jgi:hypothetical protein